MSHIYSYLNVETIYVGRDTCGSSDYYSKKWCPAGKPIVYGFVLFGGHFILNFNHALFHSMC